MKLPRDLYGGELARVLYTRWPCANVNQVGSRIILQTEPPQHHRVRAPDHKIPRLSPGLIPPYTERIRLIKIGGGWRVRQGFQRMNMDVRGGAP